MEETKERILSDKEFFSINNEVYFKKPQGPYAENLRLYIAAVGKRGPFTVMIVQKSGNPRAHPQMVTLGDSSGKTLKISFGGGEPEPLEVSGFWLTKES
ncbi:MAG: hypothetical protein WD607_06195 [Candidatus Paceibacterota bacterium]